MPKIIQYRHNCIGCGICHERQPDYWRMSRKDGKATLLRSVEKKGIHITGIPDHEAEASRAVAQACPARVIKVV